jgi:hypothetical protein
MQTDKYSLIIDRKRAFAELVRAYLRFNIESAREVTVLDDGNLSINGTEFKFDVSDYTGKTGAYIFFNPSNGRLVIENKAVKKIYKLEVDLLDQ